VVDDLARRHAQAVEDSHRPEHEAVHVARLNESELIESDVAAGQQPLAQRLVLSSRLDEERGERVGFHQRQRLQQVSELTVAGRDRAGESKDVRGIRRGFLPLPFRLDAFWSELLIQGAMSFTQLAQLPAIPGLPGSEAPFVPAARKPKGWHWEAIAGVA